MLKAQCKTGQLFEKMFNAHGAIMLLVDYSDGQIIAANDSAVNFYGYSREDLTGLKIMDINLLSSEEVEKEFKKAAREERNFFIFPHKIANGVVKIVEVHSSPIEFEDRRVLFSVIHDVTNRVEMERKLQISEERWRFSNESTKDGLWDWDLVTNQVYFSKQWKEMLGYKDYEIGNEYVDWEDRVFPEDLPKSLESIKNHLEGKTPFFSIEYRMIHKDGSLVWILDRGKVISRDESGKALRAVGTHVNITKMKRLHEELESANKALLNAMKKVSTLEGILPICSGCKKIRDDDNKWNFLEDYIQSRTKAEFSHGLCPDCAKKLYPEIFKGKKE